MKNQTKHFAELDFEERNKLLALSPSQWKEDSPIYFKDYARTADKTALAKSIVNLVILGEDENTDERAIELLKYLNSFADRVALAEELVDKDNFQEFSPFDDGWECSEEQQAIIDNYDGLDAFVYAATLELAENFTDGGYADTEDVVRLFEGEGLDDIVALHTTVKSIYMSNVRVLKNINHLENGVDYFVVNEDQISEIAADGTTFDYSLENGESTCWSDLESELEKKYKGLSFAISEGNEIDIDTWDSDDEALEEAERTNKIEKIREFAKEWLEDHECFYDCKFWNYWDGHNWQSLLLYCENPDVDNNKDYELLGEDVTLDDEPDEEDIVLAAFERAKKALPEWHNGYAHYKDEETGLFVTFSCWEGDAEAASVSKEPPYIAEY